MSAVNTTDARNNFVELINRANYSGERIRIERHGKPVAAIISCEDLACLEALEDARDSEELRRAMAESKGFVTINELLASRPIE